MKHPQKRKPARRTPNRSRRDLEHTAYHEAGHAVIGRVLSVPCGDVTIVPDYKKQTRGVAIVRSDPYELSDNWDERGKFRGRDQPRVPASCPTWPPKKQR